MKTRFYCVTVRVYENGRIEVPVTSREAALMPLYTNGVTAKVAWSKKWFEKKTEAVAYAKAAEGDGRLDFNTASQEFKATRYYQFYKKEVAA